MPATVTTSAEPFLTARAAAPDLLVRGRDVAVKVLHRQKSRSRSAIARFEREARVASMLRHPNSIVTFDFGESPHGLYIAMELLKGITLHERMVHLIEQLGMPVSEVALVINKYVKALLRALVESGDGHELPKQYTEPWPIRVDSSTSNTTFPMDRLLSMLDEDRIDILDTLIRTTIDEINLLPTDALLVMRSWEQVVRTQLAKATGPGSLFSPVEVPDGF